MLVGLKDGRDVEGRLPRPRLQARDRSSAAQRSCLRWRRSRSPVRSGRLRVRPGERPTIRAACRHLGTRRRVGIAGLHRSREVCARASAWRGNAGGPVRDGAGTAVAPAEAHGESGDGGWAAPSRGRVMRAAGAHSFPASDPPPWTLGTLRGGRGLAHPSRIWRILQAVKRALDASAPRRSQATLWHQQGFSRRSRCRGVP